MTLSESYRLTDRYELDDGKVFMSGLHALARVPVDQLRVDQRQGHNTSAFVSGYPGSPLGGFDSAIEVAIAQALDVSIVHTPALNEEYAATAVMGSQLVTAQPDCLVDGVVGIWYGKAPGLDRASDAIRIAMAAGTDRLGGAVAFVGDDPAAKSSTIPSSRAGVLADMHLPVLFPSNPSEILDLGRHAIAMSRATGLWVGVKVVSDVADGTGTVDLETDRVVPVVPTINGEPYGSRPNSRLLAAEGVEAEREIFEVRDALARIYGAENHLNQVTVDPPDAWIGVVAPGSTYRETRQALRKLGLDDDDAVRGAGVRLLHLRMTCPLDRDLLRRFADGLEEILVVEDKDPNVEDRLKAALYGMADAPVIVGKQDEQERPLLPGHGTLLADAIAPALRRRLERRVPAQLEPEEPVREKNLIPLSLERTPFFCSGCPHNSSTVVPEGSLVGSGIGCHTMVLLLDEERVGDIIGITAMGNEGAQWLGMADFLGRRHFIHNVGDGTYFHSGQLAIQAAVAAGVSMTFKILYNGALAMTGGQSAQGQRSVPDLAAQLKAVGVERVLITTDEVARYRGVDLPGDVEVWDRSRVLEAQEVLAALDGVTVMIHDQDCAAELRRERKRGRKATPKTRVVINHRICEGCGDCGEKSNCLSVQPFDTEWGRKTTIDQSSCNIDLSCLEGDCPSFMTVTQREPRAAGRARQRDLDPLPDPLLVVPDDDFAVHITGIGGTGVVTVAQTLGTAAMFDGYEVAGLDQTGLSQKAGPVVSDVRLQRIGSMESNRVGDGQADLLLALDQLVAASPRGLSAADPRRTTVVGSTSLMPTGSMISRPDIDTPGGDELAERIQAASRPDHQYWADAAALTNRFLGHAIYANVFVVGMAVQAGCIPITPASIEQALRLNDVDVENNLAAFWWGRRAICSPESIAQSTAGATESTPDLVERLRLDLVAFQDDACAQGFVEFVHVVGEAERVVAPGSSELTRAVAVNLHKLTAYKDEYEVARLMLDPGGRQAAEDLAAEDMAGSGASLAWRLHPPMLRALGMRSKITVGEWATPAVRVLARGKRLRGTAFDPFGRASVRVLERELAPEYRQAIRTVLANLSADNLAAAVDLAELPDSVRGYEDLKVARAREYRSRLAAALERFEAD
ncbi:MAG: indolepyruvate ferredoxin oxidoreductase family protein [Acidimicrobiales bacterium]